MEVQSDGLILLTQRSQDCEPQRGRDIDINNCINLEIVDGGPVWWSYSAHSEISEL